MGKRIFKKFCDGEFIYTPMAELVYGDLIQIFDNNKEFKDGDNCSVFLVLDKPYINKINNLLVVNVIPVY